MDASQLYINFIAVKLFYDLAPRPATQYRGRERSG